MRASSPPPHTLLLLLVPWFMAADPPDGAKAGHHPSARLAERSWGEGRNAKAAARSHVPLSSATKLNPDKIRVKLKPKQRANKALFVP